MKKRAFTLAEVLITLGIIGVVAAMTMPTLITNVQNKIFYTRFMKARNMIENALQMYENEHGYLLDYQSKTFSETVEDAKDFTYYFKGATFIDESNWEEECSGYNKKNAALNYDGTEREVDASGMCSSMYDYGLGLKTRDGMLIILNDDLGAGTGGYVDTDGPNSGPNTMGRDIFVFYLEKYKRENEYCGNIWGLTKACAEKMGRNLGPNCTENSKRGDECGLRLIEEGKMAY